MSRTSTETTSDSGRSATTQIAYHLTHFPEERAAKHARTLSDIAPDAAASRDSQKKLDSTAAPASR